MLKLNVTKICSIENCEVQVFSKGWCAKHFSRWRRHGDPNVALQIHGNDEKRFWSQVNKTEGLGRDGECWEWTGYLTPSGYGQIYIDGRLVLTHRYSFFLQYGHYPQPIGRHSCDNPACIRPLHILEGTQSDNMADMVARHRQAVGERRGNWKHGKKAKQY